MKMQRILIVILFSVCLSIGVRAQIYPCRENPQHPELEAKIDPDNPFPKEVEGFRFFKEGKLRGILLGVSSRDDFERIFGPPTVPQGSKGIYDYDSDWKMSVIYISREGTSKISRYIKDGVEHQITLVPKPEYLGKIQQIELIPKKEISFNNIIDQPNLLKPFNLGRTSNLSIIYSDDCNLTYVVHDEKNGEKNAKGNLTSILYYASPWGQAIWLEEAAPFG